MVHLIENYKPNPRPSPQDDTTTLNVLYVQVTVVWILMPVCSTSCFCFFSFSFGSSVSGTLLTRLSHLQLSLSQYLTVPLRGCSVSRGLFLLLGRWRRMGWSLDMTVCKRVQAIHNKLSTELEREPRMMCVLGKCPTISWLQLCKYFFIMCQGLLDKLFRVALKLILKSKQQKCPVLQLSSLSNQMSSQALCTRLL